MSIYPPAIPSAPPDPPADDQQVDPADLITPASGPPPLSVGTDRVQAWSAVAVVVLVLGGVAAMLFTGHEIHEALLLAGGVILLGVGIARRLITDGGLMPTLAIAGAVTVFAVIAVILGYAISDIAVVCGGAGLLAGEVMARLLRSPGRGV